MKAAQGQGGSSAEGKERKKVGERRGEGQWWKTGAARGEGMRREGRGI